MMMTAPFAPATLALAPEERLERLRAEALAIKHTRTYNQSERLACEAHADAQRAMEHAMQAGLDLRAVSQPFKNLTYVTGQILRVAQDREDMRERIEAVRVALSDMCEIDVRPGLRAVQQAQADADAAYRVYMERSLKAPRLFCAPQ